MLNDNAKSSRLCNIHVAQCVYALSVRGSLKKVTSLYALGDWAIYTRSNNESDPPTSSLYLEVLMSPESTQIIDESSVKLLESEVTCVRSYGTNYGYFLTAQGELKAVSALEGFVYTVSNIDSISSCHEGEYTMCIEEEIGLAALVSSRRIVLLSLDIPRIPLSCGCKHEVHIDTYFDVVPALCAVWGMDDVRDTTLVFSGQSASLFSMALHVDQDQGSAGDGGGGGDAHWKPIADTLGTDVDDTKDHTAWITALSSGRSGLGLSGDALGTVIVWRFDLVDGTRKLTQWYTTPFFSRSAILTISRHHVDIGVGSDFWVYDASGVYTQCSVNMMKPNLTKLKRIVEQCRGPLSELTWRMSPQGGDDPHWVLRSTSIATGSVVDRIVTSEVSTSFSLALDARRGRGHRNAVSCIVLVKSMSYLVAAFTDRTLAVFDYITGERLSLAVQMARRITSLAAHPLPEESTGIYDAFKVLAGAENGVLSEISVRVRVLESQGNASKRGGGDMTYPNPDDEEDNSILDMLESELASTSLVADTNTLVATVSRTDADMGVRRQGEAAGISTSLTFSEGPSKSVVDSGMLEDKIPYAPSNNGSKTALSSTARDDDTSLRTRCSFKLMNKADLCPLAVTSLNYSTLGSFAAVTFGQGVLNLYESSTNKIITHVDLDKSVREVTSVDNISRSVDAAGETLVVALRGDHSVKFLDLIGGRIVGTCSASPHVSTLAGACVWQAPGPDVDPATELPLNKTFGAWIDEDSGLYTFTGDRAEPRIGVEVMFPLRDPDTLQPSPDRLLCGSRALIAGTAPVLCFWRTRGVTCAVIDTDFEVYDITVLRSFSYHITDPRIRVIHAESLERTPRDRSSRVLLVLSDGTSMVIAVT